MKNHISIIIVNYNTPDETKDCLRSLDNLETWGFDYQVIVLEELVETFGYMALWLAQWALVRYVAGWQEDI